MFECKICNRVYFQKPGVCLKCGYKSFKNLDAKNKYNAEKTTVDGVTFDSKKEGARFFELKLLQDRKEITELQRQVKFQIVPKAGKNERAHYYVADFTYKEYGKQVIEDVKSPATKANAVYSLKKALVLWQYPEYEFRET